jgi:hypothetical protein
MAEGKFIISAQNKIKEGLDGAKKDLLGFEDAAKSVGDRVKTALTVTAIAAGLVKLGKVAFECFEEFGEGDRRIKQLGIALDGNESSLAKATTLIDEMRKMSLASKDDIEGLVTELAALGRSDKDIDNLTRASVNLSNVTGKDLMTSYGMLAQAQAGQTRSLEILLPEVANLTKEELAAGGATNFINEKFSALSSTLAKGDVLQNLKNMKDGFSELKENLGWITSGVFSGFTSLLSAFVDNLNQAFGKYKAFLGAKNALNFEDQAKNLLISKGYYEADTTAAGKALAARLAFLRQEAQRQVPGIQGRELNTKVDSLKLNDSSYQAAVAWADDIAVKLKGINTALAKIKAETGIDYATKFDAGTLRTVPGGGAAGGGSGKDFLGSRSGSPAPDESGAYTPDYSFLGVSSLFKKIGELGQEVRDDLENYGWGGLGETAAESIARGWARGIDAGMRPEEGEGYAPNYSGLGVNKTIQEFFSYFDGAVKESRDDLESYGWEGLGKTSAQEIAEGWAKGIDAAAPPDEGGGYAVDYSFLGRKPTKDYGAGGAASFQSNGGGQVQAPTWLDEIGAVFGSLGTTIGPIISQFGGMFASISSVMQILNPVQTILTAMFEVIEPVVNELLTPIVGILNVLGSALGDMLVPILEALSPVILALSEAFVWLYNNVIVPVGNLIYSMMATVWNGIAAAINFLLGWLGVKLEYMDASLAVLDRITLNDVQSAGESTVSDSTSAASANYATQSITVNIYQQGILIGNDGMTTLARTVRDEIDLLAYAGR